MTLAVEVGARPVTTIEGLARGETQAFVTHDAMQCGFCTPGMAMSAAALLGRIVNPTAEDVERGSAATFAAAGATRMSSPRRWPPPNRRRAEPWPRPATRGSRLFRRAVAAYRFPAPVMWPAVSSSAAMSRNERLRLLTG
jgi:hypothetical protein